MEDNCLVSLGDKSQTNLGNTGNTESVLGSSLVSHKSTDNKSLRDTSRFGVTSNTDKTDKTFDPLQEFQPDKK